MNPTRSRQITSSENSLSELRLKIAELCPSLFLIRPGTFTKKFTYWNDDGKQGPAVDITRDLNACAEVRRTLTPGERDMFVIHLAHVVHADYLAGIGGSTITAWKFIDATAEQQCRAFIELKASRPKAAGSVPKSNEGR